MLEFGGTKANQRSDAANKMQPKKRQEYLEINHLHNPTWEAAGMVTVLGTALVFFLEDALQ